MSLIPIDEAVHFDVATHDPATGAVIDADSAPTFDVFEEATDTPILDDQTMTKRTSLTGNYRGTFTASAANGFEAGKWYSVIVTATVDSITAKDVAKNFRVGPAESSAGVPKVDVSHAAGTAWASGAITAASIASDAITDAKVASDVTIASVTGAVGSVAGAVGSVTGNVGGNVTGSVGSIASGGITTASFATGAINAAAIAADAITDAKVAADVTIASVTGAVGSVTGSVGGNVTGSVGSVASGGITAASFAANAITAAKLDPDVTTELQAGLATAANLATVAGYLDTEIAAILADTNELQTDWANGGRLDVILDARASQASVDTVDTVVDGIKAVTDVLPDAGALTSLATAAALTTVDTVVDAIKVTTDKVDDTLEDDAGTFRFTTNALEQAPTGGSAPSAAAIRAEIDSNSTQLAAIKAVTDKVDDTLEDDAGTQRFTANALEQAPSGTGASAASIRAEMDANSTQLAAILADTAAVDARLPSDPADASVVAGLIAGVEAKVDTVDTVVDAILVDTAEIGTAGAGLTAIASASTLATVAGYLDTEVAAIKAKTDNLPAAPAAVGDIPSAATVASQVRTELGTELGRIDAAVSTRATPVQVNAEVVDALNVDTYAEPTGAPPATATLTRKIGQVYKHLRNEVTQTATTQTVKNDGGTADVTATVSDDGTTTTRAKWS